METIKIDLEGSERVLAPKFLIFENAYLSNEKQLGRIGDRYWRVQSIDGEVLYRSAPSDAVY